MIKLINFLAKSTPRIEIRCINEGISYSCPEGAVTEPEKMSNNKVQKCPIKTASLCYHNDVEAQINTQISMELSASYSYFAMFCNFSRSDVSLTGCYLLFKQLAKEEQEHALKLCDYQTMRGGTIKLVEIPKPYQITFTVIQALTKSMELEQQLADNLTEVHATAVKHNDVITADYITSEFIKEQVFFLQLNLS